MKLVGPSTLGLASPLAEGDWCPEGGVAELAQLVTAGRCLSPKSRVRSPPPHPRAGMTPRLGGGRMRGTAGCRAGGWEVVA